MYGWFSRVGKPDPKPGQIWRWFSKPISPWPQLDTRLRIHILDVREGAVKFEYSGSRGIPSVMRVKELKSWWKLEKDIEPEN